MPAVDERELGAALERLRELGAVAADRHRGVVRGEHETDNRLRAAGDCSLRRVGDPRRPVLHPGEDGHVELALERRARLLGDRVERRSVLDPEQAIPLDEIVEQLRSNRLPAADVRVVRGDVAEPLGRPVGHQDDGDRRSSRHSRVTPSSRCLAPRRRPRRDDDEAAAGTWWTRGS